MRTPFMWGLAVFWACLLHSACNVSQSQSVDNGTRPNRMEDAYYQKLGSNIERLHALREGLFVMYVQYQNKDKAQLWETDNGDSILVYSRSIGTPSRDGFWLVHQQFMSSLPGEPILTYVENLERISRDTFVGHSYIWEDAPNYETLLQEDFSLPSDFDYDALKEGEFYEKLTYVRQHSAHFKGYSPKTNILNLNLRAKYSSQKDFYDIRPAVMTLRRLYLAENDSIPNIPLNNMTHEMRRFPNEARAAFQEETKAEE